MLISPWVFFLRFCYIDEKRLLIQWNILKALEVVSEGGLPKDFKYKVAGLIFGEIIEYG